MLYPKQPPELKDTAADFNCLLQKSIAKGVKDFPKRLEVIVSANGRHFEYKM